MTPPHTAIYLNSFIDYERDLQRRSPQDFKLGRMRRLLQEVGNPQDRLLAVHIAGSKGKGSTCAMLAHILKAAGYRTGLYTSPHIDTYHERIRVLGGEGPASPGLFADCIRDEVLEDVLADYREAFESLRDTEAYGRLTFYEVFTAVALLHFVRCGVDVAVLETGLGGRLDATNTVPARAAVITAIGLEHTAILGETLAAIAAEKAAIIKSGQQVIVAPQEASAAAVIHEHCAAVGVTPRLVRPEMVRVGSSTTTGQVISVNSGEAEYPDLRLALSGLPQQINAATAICTAECLKTVGLSVSREAIDNGLAGVRWPLRFERVGTAPEVIIDAAHSRESLEALKLTLHQLLPGKRIVAVIGMSADKNPARLCPVIAQFADHVFLTAADHPRAYRFQAGDAGRLFAGGTAQCVDGLNEALDRALVTAGPDGVVIVTGSLFIAAQARRRWAAGAPNNLPTGS
ncbi:MAG: bifunctional folylpolyglutamate synthase/dihydrofolate synthase [Candidatus Omnitrophica bacterium]|nr:bifunctional folylpolyglutamate synthase/dihydrofolate synthase [Candidatus Omnitrophota bacterium]MCB9719831.1 bifunctional folylpolyglutamate synthase/dihydrofolate synthase [Candidatus Omnitrophota bacterium]